MFGFGKSTPGGLAGNEKLMILGSLLSDLGAGQGPQRILATQGMLKNQREEAKKQELVQGLLARLQGGSASGAQGGTLGGLAGNELGALAVLGVPGVKELIDIRGQEKPTYEEGVRIANPYAATNPAFIPKRVEGMEPSFGPGGQLSMGNINGFVPSMAQMEMAKTNAQEAAKSMYIGQNAYNQSRGTAMGSAPFQDVTVTGQNGEPITMSRERFAGSGPFVGQAPAARIVAEGQAKNQVEGAQELSSSLQSAQTARDVINQIRTHPGFKSRVGMTAMLPALPGTTGKDFDVLVDQAKGQVFMQAFQSLKGAGQITEQEGKAATAAMARLNTAQSPAGFNKALDDLERIIGSAESRARQKAGVGQQARPDRSAVEAELRRRGLIR